MRPNRTHKKCSPICRQTKSHLSLFQSKQTVIDGLHFLTKKQPFVLVKQRKQEIDIHFLFGYSTLPHFSSKSNPRAEKSPPRLWLSRGILRTHEGKTSAKKEDPQAFPFLIDNDRIRAFFFGRRAAFPAWDSGLRFAQYVPAVSSTVPLSSARGFPLARRFSSSAR